ncbi:MAG TPA: hypothetical protein VGD29_25855, partial [Actinoplanes sp.]
AVTDNRFLCGIAGVSLSECGRPQAVDVHGTGIPGLAHEWEAPGYIVVITLGCDAFYFCPFCNNLSVLIGRK